MSLTPTLKFTDWKVVRFTSIILKRLNLIDFLKFSLKIIISFRYFISDVTQLLSQRLSTNSSLSDWIFMRKEANSKHLAWDENESATIVNNHRKIPRVDNFLRKNEGVEDDDNWVIASEVEKFPLTLLDKWNATEHNTDIPKNPNDKKGHAITLSSLSFNLIKKIKTNLKFSI